SIDRQDDGFDLVALLETTYGFFAHFVPGDVGQVNQTIDAAVQTNEDTEIGDRLDGAGDLVALVELAGELFPRVHLALLDAQGDTTTVFVDVQNHDLHFVANLNDLGRMDVLVGPIHLGYVNQAFHTLFQLGEAAVVGEVGDLGVDTGTFRITTGDSNPWIFAQLLQTQRNADALAVELQHLDVEFVPNDDDLGRILDSLPVHLGTVQQPI